MGEDIWFAQITNQLSAGYVPDILDTTLPHRHPFLRHYQAVFHNPVRSDHVVSPLLILFLRKSNIMNAIDYLEGLERHHVP